MKGTIDDYYYIQAGADVLNVAFPYLVELEGDPRQDAAIRHMLHAACGINRDMLISEDVEPPMRKSWFVLA